MNIDDDLRREWDEDTRSFYALQSQEKQHRRQTLILTEVKTVIQCVTKRGMRRCEQAIASTEIHEGHIRFKIMLIGTARTRKDKVLVEVENNQQWWEHDDIAVNLGGKCPTCGTVHSFRFEEVARILGFADCESALRTRLTGGNYLRADPEHLAGGFLANFVHRMDGCWQNPSMIHESAFFFYEDGEDDPARENS